MTDEEYIHGNNNPNYIRGLTQISKRMFWLLYQTVVILGVAYAGYLLGQEPQCTANLNSAVMVPSAVEQTTEEAESFGPSLPLKLEDAR
ncbi:MAG: hypothetical protein ABL958_01575 [Bdellovibrionia bacterium]